MVFQAVASILYSANETNAFGLTVFEVIVLLISSAGHDYGHPGQNNHFLVQTQSQLALNYNDRSVLENFHAAELTKIIRQDDYNILGHFPQTMRVKVCFD